MASNTTEHYSLPLWEMDDRILMDDFNDAMSRIDTALHAKAGAIVFGSYTGDNAESRTISLGATPKAVLLVRADGVMGHLAATGDSYVYGALAVEGADAELNGMTALKITDGGFSVYQASLYSKYYVHTNNSSYTYHYVAFF